MKFGGLQKLTLLDYPEKVACTVFCTGCNFRCPFCHNRSLVDGCAEYSQEDILAFLDKRKGVLEGICLSGGEPLIYSDVADFLLAVKQMGYKIKLDTNGSFPARLNLLIKENLVDYVAMDVKNSPQYYQTTVGANVDVNAVCQSVEILLRHNVAGEFRTTVTRTFHNAQRIEELAQWLRRADKWYLQQFVHSDDLIDSSVEGYSDEELRALLEIARRYCGNVALRGI